MRKNAFNGVKQNNVRPIQLKLFQFSSVAFNSTPERAVPFKCVLRERVRVRVRVRVREKERERKREREREKSVLHFSLQVYATPFSCLNRRKQKTTKTSL